MAAGGWTFVGYGVSLVVRFGTTLVMTRLLAPEMYGVVAIATTVTVIIALMTDIGLSQNVVQSRRGDDPLFLNTVWTVQIIRGVILWLGVSVIAGALQVAQSLHLLGTSHTWGAQVLPAVLAVTGVSALIGGLQSTKAAMANRNFDQRRLTMIELISQAFSVATMLILAVTTRSIWSLVLGALAATLVSVILTHWVLEGPPNRLAWDAAALREIIAFGRWIFVSSFVGVFALNADRLLLGGLVHAAELGHYAIAIALVGTVSGAFTRLYATVAMPALSETARREPDRLKEIYYRVRLPSDVVLLFLAGLLFAGGSEIVNVLFDDRYAAVGTILEVMAVSLIWVRYEVAQKLYLSLGLPRHVALINFARLPAILIGIAVGYRWGGFIGAVWGIALHQLPLALLVHWFNAKLRINDAKKELLALLAFPVGAAVVWVTRSVA